MTDIYKIRLANARTLMEGMKQAEFARKIQKPDTQVSRQMGKNPRQNIGDDMARHIERCFNKPTGWMDIQHKNSEDAPLQVVRNYAVSGTVRIPMYDAELAAGSGAHIDMDAVSEFLEIPESVLSAHGLNPESIVGAKVRGDSMIPRLMDGDTILIDTSDKRPKDGKIYAIAVEGELRVKRILRPIGGNHVVITSDNKTDPSYRDETISAANFESLRVIGRVVSIWFSGM